jgi:hypothetical protein
LAVLGGSVRSVLGQGTERVMGGGRVDDCVPLLAGLAVLVGQGVNVMLSCGGGLLRGELDIGLAVATC